MTPTIISISSSSSSEDTTISISSSSSSEDDDLQESQSESEFQVSSDEADEEEDDDDDYDESELDDRSYEEEGNEHHSDKQILQYAGDDNRIYNSFSRLAKEMSRVQQLNLSECKSYLRRHGLRLTGAKEECILRINEHRRIKDKSGEALYPKSSFSINCTGDVCKGDVVLFAQKVYDKFDKMTRKGCLKGKRTVAGRIVKESYGAAKQQHTFTVEVLWSKGAKSLPPLFPLLVKGRKLYKLGTFRQRWKNEVERVNVLAEKHRRGAAARQIRAMRKTKHGSCIYAGAKHQKLSHVSPKKKTTKQDREKYVGRHRTSPVKNIKSNNPLPYPRPLTLTRTNDARLPAFQSNSYSYQREYHYSQAEYLHQTASSGFSSWDTTSSTARISHPGYYPNSYRNSTSEGFNRGAHLHCDYSHSTNDTVQKNFNQHPRSMNPYQPVYPYYARADEYYHWNHTR